MDEERKYDLIEQYLAGVLSEQARLDFEKQLQTDPALQQEVQLHEQVANTLKGDQVHQLRTTLQSVDQSWQLETPAKPAANTFQLPVRRLLALAASILALVFAYYTFAPSTTLGPENLYASNFEPYKMVLNQRSTTDAIADPNTFRNAIAAYENQDFVQAATLFQSLQEAHPDIIAFPFYQAIAHLAQENTSTAITLLEKVLAKPDHLFVEQSRWYLALAYLQSGDVTRAKKQLGLIEAEGYKYAEAQELLRELQ